MDISFRYWRWRHHRLGLQWQRITPPSFSSLLGNPVKKSIVFRFTPVLQPVTGQARE